MQGDNVDVLAKRLAEVQKWACQTNSAKDSSLQLLDLITESVDIPQQASSSRTDTADLNLSSNFGNDSLFDRAHILIATTVQTAGVEAFFGLLSTRYTYQQNNIKNLSISSVFIAVIISNSILISHVSSQFLSSDIQGKKLLLFVFEVDTWLHPKYARFDCVSRHRWCALWRSYLLLLHLAITG